MCGCVESKFYTICFKRYVVAEDVKTIKEHTQRNNTSTNNKDDAELAVGSK